MLEHLWNGWRAAYVQKWEETAGTAPPPGSGSVFTRILASGMTDEAANIVERGATCFVILNAFPYASGHLLVMPYREVADLEDLTHEETVELWALVTKAVRVVKGVYAPQALNVGINLGPAAGGSISQHLHVHVVPRWVGDSNFMTAVANTRTLPEPLADSAAKLRKGFASL